MLERESGGAVSVAGDDQRRDLDDLALTTGRCARVPPGAGDVLRGRGSVVAVRGHDREEGMLDRVHRGDPVVPQPRREGPRRMQGQQAKSVMAAAWARVLTER